MEFPRFSRVAKACRVLAVLLLFVHVVQAVYYYGEYYDSNIYHNDNDA